jgi:hypothetical protein
MNIMLTEVSFLQKYTKGNGKSEGMVTSTLQPEINKLDIVQSLN